MKFVAKTPLLMLRHTLSRPIARNTLLKLASELIGRAVTFALGLWAARQLGSVGFGLYNLALAQGFVLAQLGDMGLQTLITREVALQAPLPTPTLPSPLPPDHSPLTTHHSLLTTHHTAWRWKWALALPVTLLLWLFSAGRSPLIRLSFLALGLALLAQTFLEYAAYVFRGQQRLRREAQFLTAARLLTALSGGFILWRGGGLPGLALASLASVSLTAAWAYSHLKREGWFQARPQPLLSPFSRALWQQALPLGAATFLSISYTRLPLFWLEARLDAAAVAHFSAAQRLVEPMQILPASFLAALFPAYSHALRHDPRRAHRLGWLGALLLMGSGAAVALLLGLAAPWLINYLYGAEFHGSIPVLQWLSWSVLPAFVNYSLTHYLIAHGQQRWLTLFMGIMLALHGGLSWLLIPHFGPAGPAISVLAAETALLFACLTVLAKQEAALH